MLDTTKNDMIPILLETVIMEGSSYDPSSLLQHQGVFQFRTRIKFLLPSRKWSISFAPTVETILSVVLEGFSRPYSGRFFVPRGRYVVGGVSVTSVSSSGRTGLPRPSVPPLLTLFPVPSRTFLVSFLLLGLLTLNLLPVTPPSPSTGEGRPRSPWS